MKAKLIVVFLLFVLGIYYIMRRTTEPFGNIKNKSGAPCADLLLQKGSDFYLLNSKLANVPGVNPVRFKNLEEYVEFTEWQRSQGLLCPILYLQETIDVQGETVYKARPSPTNMQGGLPDYFYRGEKSDERDMVQMGNPDSIYNKNSYPAFDPDNQDIGLDTPLDKMFNESEAAISPNPMDTNWGGAEFTDQLIKAGYYKDNEVIRGTSTF
jgi:hypothetical protein